LPYKDLERQRIRARQIMRAHRERMKTINQTEDMAIELLDSLEVGVTLDLAVVTAESAKNGHSKKMILPMSCARQLGDTLEASRMHLIMTTRFLACAIPLNPKVGSEVDNKVLEIVGKFEELRNLAVEPAQE
jgi:hypothetical protein